MPGHPALSPLLPLPGKHSITASKRDPRALLDEYPTVLIKAYFYYLGVVGNPSIGIDSPLFESRITPLLNKWLRQVAKYDARS